MADWATPEDVASAATQWSDGQVNCRVYGHVWRPLTVTHRPGVYTIYQRCGRCRCDRWQEVDDRGYPLSGWNITYIDGYLMKNLGRLGSDGRAVLRLRTFRGLPIHEVQDT